MGLLSWWTSKGLTPPPPSSAKVDAEANYEMAQEVFGMNGAVEVRRPMDVTVFEFGSVAASGDRITLTGYCPVSEELEPCRWEIIPSAGPDAPQFRIVF